MESAGTLQDCDVAVRSRSAPPNRTSCGFVWLIWFLRSIWFKQINKTSQTNQLTETNQTHRTDQTNETGWRRFSASLLGLSARPGGRPSGPRLGGSPLFGKVSDGRQGSARSSNDPMSCPKPICAGNPVQAALANWRALSSFSSIVMPGEST